ncbi:MAG: FadR family transcriptional regulator [bacterium]|nr:FadR family transcriptional regulator [bacterium]
MMKDILKPIKTESAKEVFIKNIEELILSGKMEIGEKLPSEREMASLMGVSRPVVHEGLLELTTRGLVTIKPRSGTVVNDFRREGSIEMLKSIVNFTDGKFEPVMLASLLELRMVFELEYARCAAMNRKEEHIAELNKILVMEDEEDEKNIEGLIELDFEFHHAIAIATCNVVYPLLINSFKRVYTNLTRYFYGNPLVSQAAHDYHKRIAAAIIEKDVDKTCAIMAEMLTHGEKYLKPWGDYRSGNNR